MSLNTIEKEKPLLVFLDGSSPLPIFRILKKADGSEQVSTGIAFNTQKFSENFHIVLISKPGIPFSDTLRAETGREFKKNYKVPETYTKLLSHNWRVTSASTIIEKLYKELPIKDREVIAFGYSQGGQVVAKLALENDKITKVVNVFGGGLNHFYDLILEERIKVRLGEITSEKAQKNIDSLYIEFEKIYKDPKAIDKEFWGHSYLIWSSFTKNLPVEDMTQLNIPILMITAGMDENAQILGLDYVKLEFLRLGKDNLTYKVFQNCDHYFYDVINKEYKLAEMEDFIIDWINKK